MPPSSLLWIAAAFILLSSGLIGVELEGSDIKPSCDFKETDVKYFDIHITNTRVPTNLTTYVCQNIPIPMSMDRDYHAIGFMPLLQNKDVVHHMILFGCTLSYRGPSQNGIHYCGTEDNECRHFLVQWSRGIEGSICSHPDTGVRFGLSSVKSLNLQIHWNNQFNADGMADASGFRVFYTSQLRKHDSSNVQIGQNYLEIPPGQAHTTQSGSCSSECTREWLPHPIYLTRAHIHMHFTGSGGAMHILRNGVVVHDVLNDASYEYDQPPAHSFSTPVEVLPGDEIRVTCIFNSKDGKRNRTKTIYWGEGSDGEMCYAFVTYYPKVKHFNQCIQFDEHDICTENGFAPLGNCIIPSFVHVFEGMGNEILHQCTSTTTTTSAIQRIEREEDSNTLREERICSHQCQAAISEVTEHPCMQGQLEKESRRVYLPEVPIWPQVKNIMDEAKKICN